MTLGAHRRTGGVPHPALLAGRRIVLNDVAGAIQADADHPPLVVASVAGQRTERCPYPTTRDGQRAALLHHLRVRAGQVDRPVPLDCTGALVDGEHLVPDVAAELSNDVQHAVGRDRGTGDAERVDVAARALR